MATLVDLTNIVSVNPDDVSSVELKRESVLVLMKGGRSYDVPVDVKRGQTPMQVRDSLKTKLGTA